jgi:hypothetical protein
MLIVNWINYEMSASKNKQDDEEDCDDDKNDDNNKNVKVKVSQ